MYNWFNKHLQLGQPEPVVERPIVPVPPRELSVYDAEHPLPGDALPADRLRKYLTETSDQQLAGLLPKDAAGLKEFRRVVGTALRVMIHDKLPAGQAVDARPVGGVEEHDGVQWRKVLLGRQGEGEQIPVVSVRGPDSGELDATTVVWIHPAGKASLMQDGKLVPAARQILERKAT